MSDFPSINRSKTWVLFVEDPGAALFARFLPDALKNVGVQLKVLATGHAKAYFEDCSMPESMSDGTVSSAHIFNIFQPELLIIGTSENQKSFAFSLCDEAKKRGIPSVGLVDSAANVSERFRGETNFALSHAPDWLIVPDSWTAKSFEYIGFRKERILAAGHPRFDEIYDQRCKWTDTDRSNQREKLFGINNKTDKVIVFVSELSTGLNHKQYERSPAYSLNGKPFSTGRTEIVLDEFLECAGELFLKPYLVLRLHPKQKTDDLRGYVGNFNFISRTETALEVVNAADLVVGMTSMLMQESALMGCPTLSIVPKSDERYWLGPMVDLIPCVWTKQQIIDILPEMLSISRDSVDADMLPKRGSQEIITRFLLSDCLSKA